MRRTRPVSTIIRGGSGRWSCGAAIGKPRKRARPTGASGHWPTARRHGRIVSPGCTHGARRGRWSSPGRRCGCGAFSRRQVGWNSGEPTAGERVEAVPNRSSIPTATRPAAPRIRRCAVAVTDTPAPYAQWPTACSISPALRDGVCCNRVARVVLARTDRRTVEAVHSPSRAPRLRVRRARARRTRDAAGVSEVVNVA